jgi:hypothetical protein
VKGIDRIAGDLLVNADVRSCGDTSGREGLKDNRGIQAAKTCSTDILADIEAAKTELSTFSDLFSGEVLVLIPLEKEKEGRPLASMTKR